MQIKKSRHVDEERFRGLFFRIGLVISILSVVFAFKWTTQREVIEFEHPDPIEITDQIEPVYSIIKEKPKPKLAILEIIDVEPDKDPFTDLFKIDPGKIDSIPLIPFKEKKEVYEESGPLDFYKIEHKPEFPGGENAMFKFLAENIVYPALEKQMSLQGLVVLQFVINKDGSISNIEVIKSISPNIDAEAVRVIEAMPHWIPGLQRDRKVAVLIKMPIRFTLAY
ncbi:MAG: energy transducer TonB [Bacteroidetes bacterium]|nr:energy transducer TonB [Bacteroidota bacterium]